MKLKKIIFPVAALSLAASAPAATLTFNDSVSLTHSTLSTLTFDEFSAGLTDGVNTVQAGDTLTGVTVTVEIEHSGGSFEVDNDNATTSEVTATLTAEIDSFTSNKSLVLQDFGSTQEYLGYGFSNGLPTGQALRLDSSAGTGTETLAANNSDPLGTLDTESGTSGPLGDNGTGYVANDYLTWAHSSTVANDSGGIIASEVSSFVGNGNVTYSVTPNQVNTTSFQGNDVESLASSGSMTFDVTLQYEYTPVPESSSFAALIGFGALGLVVLRRRR